MSICATKHQFQGRAEKCGRSKGNGRGHHVQAILKVFMANSANNIIVMTNIIFIRGMGISGMLFLLCQFTGISSLVVYMTSVFKVFNLSIYTSMPVALKPCNAYQSFEFRTLA